MHFRVSPTPLKSYRKVDEKVMIFYIWYVAFFEVLITKRRLPGSITRQAYRRVNSTWQGGIVSMTHEKFNSCNNLDLLTRTTLMIRVK